MLSSKSKEFIYIFFIIILLGILVWGSQLKLVRAEVYVCNYNIVGNSNPLEPIKPQCEPKGTIIMQQKEIEQYKPNNLTLNFSTRFG